MPPASEPPPHQAWLRDVDELEQLLEHWWANRAVHARLDGADVAAVCRQLRAQAADLPDRFAFARALRDALWRLGDGHLRLGTVEGEGAFVSDLDPVEAADGVWLRGLGALAEFDGMLTPAALDRLRLAPGSTPRHRRSVAIGMLGFQTRLPGEAPVPDHVTVRRADGRLARHAVTWRCVSAHRPTPGCVQADLLRPGVVHLRVRTFQCRDDAGTVSDAEFARQVDRAMPLLAAASHVLVDLRHNAGGRDEQARHLAQRLVGRALPWMRYLHAGPCGRAMTEIRDEALPPSPAAIEARLWVLVDAGCFSTAEILAAALQEAGACLVGGPTGGGVGNPWSFRLPWSGIALMAPVTQFFTPRGEPIEGRGLSPEILVEPTLASFERGSDLVVDAVLNRMDSR